ncbi:phosphoribosylaminoimidazole carboxylase [Grosmannia clavigera kw1407]|uniref:Phosphoribosylaminoimidazole carboxylase n=1 Tax=Grosmannia clavigera (strain kw1407 / UAMH 11150) TaxID=655863 RepID=F0XBM0_GROCL|nr:phosphoribosylaminoimidazole carboxylase [Grosmannia clavigera kw1407]EFX04970.1 phosphoribosylaminoimidazole carboxylase [Grosmannia clavigera kw1407]
MTLLLSTTPHAQRTSRMSAAPVIGLLGGGQLGRMLCEAAAPLEVEVAILDAADAPAKQVGHSAHHVDGSYKDAAKIRALATRCRVLSVETEHIDTAVLEELEVGGRVAVHPSWRTLRLIQDKHEQKAYLAAQGIPVADQVALGDGGVTMAALQTATARFGFPWMLKARRDSYDGRGNLRISGPADLERALAEFGGLRCYAERFVPFVRELSVLVIRSEDAAGSPRRLVAYPAVETAHEDSVCARVYLPPRQTDAAVCARAQAVAVRVVEHLWGKGVFAVEMFVGPDGDLLVNEIAPRPHNSGHLFTEAVPYMSQFRAQLAAILDEPLPQILEPHVTSAIMINILGGVTEHAHLPLVAAAKALFGHQKAAYVHLYGKQSKPGRKIGHITVTGVVADVAELEAFAQPLPLVLVTMGSDSDLPVLKAGIDVLTEFGVPFEVDITSAHRTPQKMGDVAAKAAARGIKVIIAAAGGAAHLPGMVSAYTALPVIGVPVKATHLDGMDSLLSIVQMPRGIPTATVGINNSTNAALLAIRCLGAFQPELHEKMLAYQRDLEKQVDDKAASLHDLGVDAYLAKMGKK